MSEEGMGSKGRQVLQRHCRHLFPMRRRGFIEDDTQRVETGTADRRLGRQERLKQCPLSVGEIGGIEQGIRVHPPAYPTPLPACYGFSDGFLPQPTKLTDTCSIGLVRFVGIATVLDL